MNLFIGSSIIERWNPLPFMNSINLGISGLTSNKLQNKYDNILSMYPTTRNIYLYIGSNDIVYNNDIHSTLKNITEFMESIINKPKHKIKIIFIAILKSPNKTKTQNIQIDYLNRKMREFISSPKNDNYNFCNCNRQLKSSENYLHNDQTHLSPIGYNRLNKCIQKI